MCTCIQDIETKIKSDNEGIKFNGLNKVLFSMNKSIIGRPIIEYKYNKIKKNGEVERKEHSGNIIASYCPFCGIKFDDKEE